ncbi:MAG: NAD(P)/FAD-dependent oxidoreductase [Clostridia bacterium]|nr:NAD(P)/FAD-dependent oxidoreductase [Clostridia bacterium]
MIRINELKLPLDYDDVTLKKLTSKTLGVNIKKIKSVKLVKRSVDARHKNDIVFSAALDVDFFDLNERLLLSRVKSNKISAVISSEYKLPNCEPMNQRPIVVGAGPAGLFASLALSRMGQKPILIERGKSVDERAKDVEIYHSGGRLDTESNVQFGEGGAGAFSDGKLNTGTKDVRQRFILEEFVKHGAPEEILWNAKPHIGTDKLRPTVRAIREEIISLGGEVRFSAKLDGIKIKDGRVTAAVIMSKGKSEIIPTDVIILALGHSARDTYKMLYDMGVVMEAKPFSVGVRIEHLQEKINRDRYGEFYAHPRLGAADYKLSTHLKNGRGVYTFCMCPGGYVMASASEENTIVTNGMSEFLRDGANANSALLVGVSPKDFGSEHPLAGIEFQRRIERASYTAGGGLAPVQRVGDFLVGRNSTSFGDVIPTYRPGTEFAKLDEYLPEYVFSSIREALPILDDRLHGFAHPDAIMTGAETRSSSPVRILRAENFNSVSVKGLYPCGEGAGYAGGIMSAAADGIRCAEAAVGK